MNTRQPALRVLYDVFELSPKGGKSIGIYHYAQQLLRALADVLPEDLTLIVPCHGDNLADFSLRGHPSAGRITCVQVADATPGKLKRQWWSRHGAGRLMRRHRCDLYFTPKGFLPGWWGAYRGFKTCAVVHDLIPLWYAQHHPGYFGWLEEQLVGRGLMRTCRHADALITISQAAAQDIKRRLPDARPATVIYNGMSPAPASSSSRPGAPAEPYLFAMTSSLPHKNAEVLLDAYARYRQLAEHPLPLVVCGLPPCDQPGVTALKGISPEQLHDLYGHSALFLFLSLTEGFGFPPLEAMLHGTPALCADIEVLRETTRGNAIFVDPHDADAIARELVHCLSEAGQPRMKALRDQAPAVVNSFQWEHCAADVLRVWRSIPLPFSDRPR